jgi:hypothetical protein
LIRQKIRKKMGWRKTWSIHHPPHALSYALSPDSAGCVLIFLPVSSIVTIDL